MVVMSVTVLMLRRVRRGSAAVLRRRQVYDPFDHVHGRLELLIRYGVVVDLAFVVDHHVPRNRLAVDRDAVGRLDANCVTLVLNLTDRGGRCVPMCTGVSGIAREGALRARSQRLGI